MLQKNSSKLSKNKNQAHLQFLKPLCLEDLIPGTSDVFSTSTATGTITATAATTTATVAEVHLFLWLYSRFRLSSLCSFAELIGELTRKKRGILYADAYYLNA